MLRNLIYITALIMLCNAAIAQKVSKLYVSKATETGILYFIKPREMPPAGKDIKPKEPVLYDVTIHSDKDTADILMSITTLTPIVFDTVTFAYNDGESATHTLQKIYIDTKERAFVGRYRCRLPKSELNTMFSCKRPFAIHFANGAKYAYKQRQWEKESKIYNTIAKLSELN